jgi:hypothetical protein
MRRYWREQQPPRMFRGAELPRLMTGMVMLAVLYMLISRAGDAGTWRWLVRATGERAAGASATVAKAPQAAVGRRPLPAASGPTDEDPDQAEEARNEFQAITDGTLTLGAEEMVPYNRLVEWVKHQSFARLYQRAKRGFRYTHFFDDAEKHRGELVALDLVIRVAGDAGKNDYGIQLYDAWGTTDQSLNRWYSVITLDYPKGMPIGDSMDEKVKFAGYFLKLQGYEPGTAKPGQAPEKAPLLIGRLEWEPTAAAASPADNTQEWIWGGALLAVIGLVFGLQFVYGKWMRHKPAVRSMIPDAATGEVISIDSWLERSGFRDPDDGLDGGGEAGR